MRSILSLIVVGGSLAALSMAQPAAQTQPRYSVKDLGTLGGNTSFAFDMNDLGWVAGSSNLVAGGPQRAFLWYGSGPLKDLGTLGPPQFPACPTCNSGVNGPNLFGEAAGASETCCNTINNRGDIVGFAIDPMGNFRALVWQGKTPMDLNNFIPQNSPLYLQQSLSLNDFGEIAGVAIVKSSCPAANPPNWQVNQSVCTEIHAFLATPTHP